MSTKNLQEDEPLHVVRLQIKSFMGFDDFVVKPGKITQIAGENGLGKTSIVNAFESVLGSGNDYTLMRKGAKFGEVVMLLSDGVEIREFLKNGKTERQVTHPEHGRLPKSATYLGNIRDALTLNPIDFVTTKKEKRLELLLESLPMKLTAIDMAGIAELCTKPIDFSRHALEVIALVETDLYDKRTGINRLAKEKRQAVEEMRKALPAVAGSTGIDWKAVLETMEAEYRAFSEAEANKKIAINDSIAMAISLEKDERQKRVQALGEERDRKIAALRTEYEGHIAEVTDHSTQVVDSLQRQKEETLANIATEAAALVSDFEQKIATAKASATTYGQAAETRKHINEMESKADKLEEDSQQLTDALQELDTLRGNLSEKLPIPGVTIKDGDILIDGLEWDSVNESRRMRMAVEVGALRSGNLKFTVVDGAERLDSKSLRGLAVALREKGIQAVFARVMDQPLTVGDLV